MLQVCNPGARSSDRILARAKEISLERRNTALRPILDAIARSSENNLARATRHKTTLARATNPWLERPTQKLDSNTWFPNPTNLKQTCPTHPITPNEKIKDDNNNYTMAEYTEPKSGYNNQMGKDRGRYTLYLLHLQSIPLEISSQMVGQKDTSKSVFDVWTEVAVHLLSEKEKNDMAQLVNTMVSCCITCKNLKFDPRLSTSRHDAVSNTSMLSFDPPIANLINFK
ncbi:unnamed protein product [Camellia sinensis]